MFPHTIECCTTANTGTSSASVRFVSVIEVPGCIYVCNVGSQKSIPSGWNKTKTCSRTTANMLQVLIGIQFTNENPATSLYTACIVWMVPSSTSLLLLSSTTSYQRCSLWCLIICSSSLKPLFLPGLNEYRFMSIWLPVLYKINHYNFHFATFLLNFYDQQFRKC